MEEVDLFTCHLQNAKRNAVYGTSPPPHGKTRLNVPAKWNTSKYVGWSHTDYFILNILSEVLPVMNITIADGLRAIWSWKRKKFKDVLEREHWTFKVKIQIAQGTLSLHSLNLKSGCLTHRCSPSQILRRVKLTCLSPWVLPWQLNLQLQLSTKAHALPIIAKVHWET